MVGRVDFNKPLQYHLTLSELCALKDENPTIWVDVIHSGFFDEQPVVIDIETEQRRVVDMARLRNKEDWYD